LNLHGFKTRRTLLSRPRRAVAASRTMA